MTPERWQKIESLFEAALERKPEERAAFLDKACAGDPTLRREVESLIAHQQPTGRFIPTLINDAAKLMPRESSFTSSMDEARFIPGTVLASRYRIIGLLGKGGMGEVYRADDLKLAQSVALKFLPEDLARDRSVLERFHREVRIARQISHPNICRIFDIGEVEGQHFISMEYIDGEDLSALLRRIGRLPSDKAVEIAQQLCAGLSAAHDERVLHRDLKPANVMIDGRGRAKITDFGLAGLADEFQGHEVRAGTPAYMAPEQLAGKEVSTRSDVYSLGLVLYEIFTGKKAFEATTLEELVRLHETTTPPSLSDHVKEIDPLVERVILRCLERDPADRPSSVSQVAAALPGGDPLAAAIAAGETPSPEMVAAAPKEGALRPAVAVACLATFFIELALVVFLSGSLMAHNSVPLEKSAEVLADRSAGIAKKFGYSDSPADTAYGFSEDRTYMDYVRHEKATFDDWKILESGQPILYHFWYRQSPRPLGALNSQTVSLADPPLELSGMANMVMDTRGRLVEFYAVPPQSEDARATVEANLNQQLDSVWREMFVEAGLDIAKFEPDNSEWTPPTYADQRAAWKGAYADHPDIPIRIEAAAYRGQPVYFQVIPPWGKPLRQEEAETRATRRAAGIILATVFFVIVIGSVLLARRNLRLGRGDRKGAFKIAIFVFATSSIGRLIGTDHVPELGAELDLLYRAVAWPLFAATFFWILYIALEPFVRRRWPRLIISWSRLLAGEFRDPMVGRDVLIGSLLGFAHTLTIYSTTFLSNAAGLAVSPIDGADPATIEGFRNIVLNLFGMSIAQHLVLGLGLMFLLLLLYTLLRKQLLAALALWLLFTTVEILAFAAQGPITLWVGPVVISTLMVVAIARFGLLTTISFQFFFDLSFHYALTPDFTSWHAHTTLIILPIIISVAVYSFYTSLAGQRVFRAGLLSD